MTKIKQKARHTRNNLMKKDFKLLKEQGLRTDVILKKLSESYFIQPATIRKQIQPLKKI